MSSNTSSVEAQNVSTLREDQIESAVAFLSHAKVRSSSAHKRVAFLEKKGLTGSEIAEALRRTVPNAEETRLVTNAAAAGQSVSAAVEHLNDDNNTSVLNNATTNQSVATNNTVVPQTSIAAASTTTPGAISHLPPGFSLYQMPGMVPVGPGLFAYPQFLNPGASSANGLQQQPPPQQGWSWGSMAIGMATALSLGAGLSYLARKYLNHMLPPPSSSSSSSPLPNNDVPRITDGGGAPDNRVSRQGANSDRFQLSTLNDDDGDEPVFENDFVGGGNSKRDDRAIEDLKIRIGDLNDRFNAQSQKTERVLSEVRELVDSVKKENSSGARSTDVADLKREFAEVRQLIMSTTLHMAQTNMNALSQVGAMSSSDRRYRGAANDTELYSKSVDWSNMALASRIPQGSVNDATENDHPHIHQQQLLRIDTESTPVARGNFDGESDMTSSQPVLPSFRETESVNRSQIFEENAGKFKAVDAALVALNATVADGGASQDDLRQCLGSLKMYMTNIEAQPNEEKYRKLQGSNKRFRERVASVQGAIDLIKAVGFEQRGNSFEWSSGADNSNLSMLKYALERIAAFEQSTAVQHAGPQVQPAALPGSDVYGDSGTPSNAILANIPCSSPK